MSAKEFDALLRELASAPPEPALLGQGARLGTYRIEAPIGQGGMGRVYRAFDTRLERPVAIKVLLSEEGEPQATMLREARLSAAVHHPNVVTVYEVGDHEGLAFLAMELVEGTTLREHLERGLSEEYAWRMATEIADALSAAHRAGVIHRDLKPENVAVDGEGHCKVLDFGIAGRHSLADLASGTARYMAPEVRNRTAASAKSDTYAFGLLLSELLRSAKIRQRGSELVKRCLNEDPEGRPGDEELRRELDGLRRNSGAGKVRESSAKVWRAAGALGLLGLIGLFGLFVLGSRPTPLTRPDRPAPATAPATETSPQTRLEQRTHNASVAPIFDVAISPDGSRLAYMERRGVFVIGAQRGDAVQVTDRVPAAGVLRFHRDRTRLIVRSDLTTLQLGEDGHLKQTSENEGVVRGEVWGDPVSFVAVSEHYEAYLTESGLRLENQPAPLWTPNEDTFVPVNLAFSPNEEWIAFSHLVWIDDEHREVRVEVVARDGSESFTAVSGPALWLKTGEAPVVWRHDNKLLYVQRAQRDEPASVWQAELEGAAVVSRTKVFDAPHGSIGSMSISHDGSQLAFVVHNNHHEISVGELNSPAGRSSFHSITFSERNEIASSWASNDALWIMRSTSTGRVVTERQELEGDGQLLRSAGSASWPVPAFDHGLVYFRGGQGLDLIRREGEIEHTLSHFPAWAGRVGIAAPRSLVIRCARSEARCFLGHVQRHSIRLESIDLERGSLEPFREFPIGRYASHGFDVSPDGERLAVVRDHNAIDVYDRYGDRVSTYTTDECFLQFLAWSYDGAGIYVTGGCPDSSYTLLYSSLEDGPELSPSIVFARPDGWLMHPRPSPDGRRIALNAMVFDSDVWIATLP